MDGVLTFPRTAFREDHEQLRETVRRFLQRECLPRQAQWDRDGRVDRETWLKAGREGLLCTTLDPRWGGGGGDFGHAAVIVEELARSGVGGLGFGLHSDIVAPYLERLGTPEQKQRWLPSCARGETILAIAMSEPGAGSDLKAIRTTARRDGDEFVIDGAKTFISNGLNCDLVVVVAKTQPELGAKGVSLILVEADRPGFRKGRKLEKMGQQAADTAELFFEQVRVPATNLLGDENRGFVHLMQELAQERFVIALGAAAKLEAMLAETVRYTKERQVFGKPLFDFQNTRFKLAEAKAYIAQLRAFVDQCVAEHVAGGITSERAAMAKLVSTETMGRFLDEFLQLHGGYGYSNEYGIGRAWVDARVSRIAGGASEVLKDIVSRSL